MWRSVATSMRCGASTLRVRGVEGLWGECGGNPGSVSTRTWRKRHFPNERRVDSHESNSKGPSSDMVDGSAIEGRELLTDPSRSGSTRFFAGRSSPQAAPAVGSLGRAVPFEFPTMRGIDGALPRKFLPACPKGRG